MNANDIVYVTGHLHPDTDSVAAAIAYAFFKRAMGMRAVPCRLGKLNAESKYLLGRFGFKEPELLTDARVKLSEIALDPPNSISPETTIFESLQLMNDSHHTYCGVVDEDKHLLGLVTKSDIAAVGLGDTAYNIDFITHTPLDNFAKVLNGKILNRVDKLHLNGKVTTVTTADRDWLARYKVKDRVVIMGNDQIAMRNVIRKGAGLLILVWTESVDEEILEAAKAADCAIILSGQGAMNTSRYVYFAPPVSLIMKPAKELVTFSGNELAEDVGVKMLRSRYHIYPVVDMDKKLLGYAARYHIMNADNKQIIMVDHNEFSQSVRAIEQARILEVIDHHRINDFRSSSPVAFRNEIIGSTATIVATIYRENQIPIPPNLAGLLLGAVLSDTMNFHSPTTTEKDIKTANILAAMADLDIEEFAQEMFAVTANTEGRSISEMINQDMKIYDIRGCKLSISQVIVTDTAEMRRNSADIQPELELFCRKKQLDLSVLVFTSIIENGSIVYSAGNHAAWGHEAFPDRPEEEHSLQQDVLSRKQQILPRITEVVNLYS